MFLRDPLGAAAASITCNFPAERAKCITYMWLVIYRWENTTIYCCIARREPSIRCYRGHIHVHSYEGIGLVGTVFRIIYWFESMFLYAVAYLLMSLLAE